MSGLLRCTCHSPSSAVLPDTRTLSPSLRPGTCSSSSTRLKVTFSFLAAAESGEDMAHALACRLTDAIILFSDCFEQGRTAATSLIATNELVFNLLSTTCTHSRHVLYTRYIRKLEEHPECMSSWVVEAWRAQINKPRDNVFCCPPLLQTASLHKHT